MTNTSKVIHAGVYTIDYVVCDSFGRKLVEVTRVIDGQVRATDCLGQSLEFSVEAWSMLRPQLESAVAV